MRILNLKRNHSLYSAFVLSTNLVIWSFSEWKLQVRKKSIFVQHIFVYQPHVSEYQKCVAVERVGLVMVDYLCIFKANVIILYLYSVIYIISNNK